MKYGIKKGSLLIWTTVVMIASFGFFSNEAWAANYYFSTVRGNDLNVGTSPASPWNSISKMQATINILQPGDIIYLERGSVWYKAELNIISKNGTSTNPIRFKPYGTGSMPVLSGEKILAGASQSGNIYTFYDNDLPEVLLTSQSYGRRFLGSVTVDGKHFATSRYPNGDSYLQATACGSTYISDDVSWSANQWQNGYATVKNVKWQWSTTRILSNTTNTLTTTQHITTSSIGAPSGTKFYYILNAYNAMDLKGEWFFNDNQLSIYWPGTIGVVRASVIDTIVNIYGSSYISFDSIYFRGSNFYGVKIREGNYNKFNHCKFSGIGENGVYVFGKFEAPPSPGASEGNEVTNCEFSDIQLCAVFFRYSRGGKITNNYIHRNGIDNAYHNLKQDYAPNPVNGFSIAVFNNLGGNPQVIRNFIDSTAGGIITHYNPYTINIRENFIRNYGLSELSDMAAFYVVSDTWSSAQKLYRKNFMLDSHKPKGTMYNDYTDSYIHAVYWDVDSYTIKADSNTIDNSSAALCANSGKYRSFKYNNINNPNAHGMNPAHANALYHSVLFPLNDGSKMESDTIVGNNFVFGEHATRAYSFWKILSSYGSSFPIKTRIDYNKYFDPKNLSSTVALIYEEYYPQNSYNLTQWQAASFQYGDATYSPDDHSTYNNTAYSAVKMFKNFSARSKTFPLTAQYVDVNGAVVSGSVTVPAFYSKFLFCTSGTASNDNDLFIDSTLIPAMTDLLSATLPAQTNQAPDILYAQFTVEEQDQLPLSIGSVVVSDPDLGQTTTCSITAGNESGLFAVSSQGALSFTTNQVNFDGNPTYELTVRVVDNGSPQLSDQEKVLISLVADDTPVAVNNAPVINPHQIFLTSFDEEVPSVIGIIQASDPDESQSLLYKVISGNAENLFSVNETTGELSMLNFPTNQVPVSYQLTVRVEDNAANSLFDEGIVTVNISASDLVYYIDPDNAKDESGDGSYENPYKKWQQVEWKENASYLQKCGTISMENKILITTNNVTIGDYGVGDKPIIIFSTDEYAIKAMEKHNIVINNIKVLADDAIGCIYFIGAACENNSVVNCELQGADYGLRIIDGKSYTVKYNVFMNDVDGIYSIADYAEIYYNVFKGNHKAINLSSYSASAKIYNNVFYDNRQGVSASYAEVNLYNNIFYLTEASDQAINHKLDKLVSNNNIFYPEQTGFLEIEEAQYSTLADYQTVYGLDLNSFSKDPLFVDVYTNNFAVSNESEAIDAGRIVGLTEDFYGQLVPFGGAPDIGLAEATTPGVTAVDDNDIFRNQISVYPNPSEGRFNLSIEDETNGLFEILVSSLSGHKLYSQTIDPDGMFMGEIDLSDSPKGMYFLSVIAKDKVYSQKLIIE